MSVALDMLPSLESVQLPNAWIYDLVIMKLEAIPRHQCGEDWEDGLEHGDIMYPNIIAQHEQRILELLACGMSSYAEEQRIKPDWSRLYHCVWWNRAVLEFCLSTCFRL